MERPVKVRIKKWKLLLFIVALLFRLDISLADEPMKKNPSIENRISTGSEEEVLPKAALIKGDSIFYDKRKIHTLMLEGRPEYVFPSNSFLRGENYKQKRIQNAYSLHLKYAFQPYPYTYPDRVYGGAYQGLGLSYFSFGESEMLGNPLALYLYQGARITRISPRVSLNYEWNLGLSYGWKPYDYYSNMDNKVIGSKFNAYINVNFYLKWMISRQWDFISGASLTHFSNGNTKFPNAGLNTVGLKLGVAYNFNRENYSYRPLYQPVIPLFPRHVSYDLVFFGSWRRKGVDFGEKQVASPNAYAVLGFNFAPMYNFGYKLRAGLSLDGVFDESANVYTEDYIVGTEQEFYKPSLKKQLALGISARGEYVMPHFTVGVGLGVNVLHGGGDLQHFYQILALKIEVSKNSFIHIGYNLRDFHIPNYLMLGFGFRFNNKYPRCYR